MDRRKILGIILIAISFVLIALFTVEAWADYNISQVNEMSRELNGAERPEVYYKAANKSYRSDIIDQRVKRTLNGTTLFSRIKLTNNMFNDLAYTERKIFGSFDKAEITDRPKKEGKYFAHCDPSESQYSCHSRPFSENSSMPMATYHGVDNFHFLGDIGALDLIWQNQTAIMSLSDYLERAKYYDKRLRKGGFQYKPIEIVRYSQGKLYIIGDHEGEIQINNKSYNPARKGKILRVDKDLKLGNHSLKAGDYSINLKITHKIPNYGINRNSRVEISNESKYQKAILKGSEGKEEFELKEKSDLRAEVPSERYPNHSTLKPFKIKFVSPRINVTVSEGAEASPRYDLMYYYGLNANEFRKTEKILQQLRKIYTLDLSNDEKILS